jgi:TRAP-type C4-dicarboxylate transport system permease small subunit
MQEERKQTAVARGFHVVGQAVRAIGALSLVVLTALVIAEVLVRFATGGSLDVVEELAGYLVVVITFFGACISLRADRLFSVDFIVALLPRGARAVLFYVYLALSLVLCLVLLRYSVNLVLSSFSRGNFAPTALATPLWLPQLIMPIGLVALIVALLERGYLFWAGLAPLHDPDRRPVE